MKWLSKIPLCVCVVLERHFYGGCRAQRQTIDKKVRIVARACYDL